MEDKFNLTEYIKLHLDTLSYKTSEEHSNNEKRAKKCLQDIGKSLEQYTNFHDMLNSMDDNSIRELHEAIEDVQFFRKRFTQFVTCSRKEANKPANDTRSIGFFTYGEYGGEYGYFKHLRKLTNQEKEWLEEYKECCYYSGQPCARWQDENGNADEDCECVLGREYATLILYELDEEHEKEMGVWKQEIIWYLDIDYNKDEPENDYFSSHDRYYSLTEVKKEAIKNCTDEKVIDKIFQYRGKYTFKEGNIMIKCVRDNDYESESDSD
jgi:hypothetical protein